MLFLTYNAIILKQELVTCCGSYLILLFKNFNISNSDINQFPAKIAPLNSFAKEKKYKFINSKIGPSFVKLDIFSHNIKGLLFQFYIYMRHLGKLFFFSVICIENYS